MSEELCDGFGQSLPRNAGQKATQVISWLGSGIGRPQAARAIEQAVDDVLNAGLLPPDLGGATDTVTITQAVLRNLRSNTS